VIIFSQKNLHEPENRCFNEKDPNNPFPVSDFLVKYLYSVGGETVSGTLFIFAAKDKLY
jgi:hypothetical protein